MQMIIENYFPERKISTGTTLFSPHKGRIFEDYHFVSSNDKRQLQFSGQFDGKIFQGNMLAVGEKPLIWKLTTEKNQILIIGNWGNIEYTIQIDV